MHREAIKRAAKLLRAAVFEGGSAAAAPLGFAWSRLQEAAVEARPVVDDILEPEVQDMVNDVDIDGDGQRMCFCQAAWQWFLWHLVVKLLGGWVQSWWCRHDVFGTVQGI